MIGRALDLVLQHRKLVTLGIVCGVAGGLWIAFNQERAKRDAAYAYAGQVCASLGSPLTDAASIEACIKEAARLAAFERDTNRQSAEQLTRHLDDQAARAATSADQARDHATAARAARAQLEEVSRGTPESVELGGDYWAAVNRAVGVRP